MIALKHVLPPVRRRLMPLLDVAAPTKLDDRAKTRQYVERNITRAANAVTGIASVFVDSSELDASFRLAGQVHPLTAAADAVAAMGCQPVPVTGPHRDAAHRGAVREVRSLHSQRAVCLRLDATDVATARLTDDRIEDLLQGEDIDSTGAYVLLDLRALYGQEADHWARQVVRLLECLDRRVWAAVIVGGYGVPDQLSTVISSKSQGYLPRVEREIFGLIATHSLRSPRWFADYTILPPSVVELDWRLISRLMCPKALYTLDNSWFVVRGGAFSSHPDKYEQYYAIAEEIVALAEYSGAEFSYGDRYIWDRSKRLGTPGSPASWITACVNHHITLTAEFRTD